MSEELKKTDIKKIAGRGCLVVAGILFLLFLCRYNQIKKEIEIGNDLIEPIDYIEKEKISKDKKEEYLKKGIEEIKKGKLAVVTMAGGQGTRLRT